LRICEGHPTAPQRLWGPWELRHCTTEHNCRICCKKQLAQSVARLHLSAIEQLQPLGSLIILTTHFLIRIMLVRIIKVQNLWHLRIIEEGSSFTKSLGFVYSSHSNACRLTFALSISYLLIYSRFFCFMIKWYISKDLHIFLRLLDNVLPLVLKNNLRIIYGLKAETFKNIMAQRKVKYSCQKSV